MYMVNKGGITCLFELQASYNFVGYFK